MHYRWTTFDDLSVAQLYELLAFRQSVFIVEQASAYADLDGKDPGCWHLIVRDRPGGALAGCLRLDGPRGGAPAFIGRIVVAPAQRGGGLGGRLVWEGLRFMAEFWPHTDVHLGAQIHLRDWYARFGFQPVGEPYDDGGILHIDMVRPAGCPIQA